MVIQDIVNKIQEWLELRRVEWNNEVSSRKAEWEREVSNRKSEWDTNWESLRKKNAEYIDVMIRIQNEAKRVRENDQVNLDSRKKELDVQGARISKQQAEIKEQIDTLDRKMDKQLHKMAKAEDLEALEENVRSLKKQQGASSKLPLILSMVSVVLVLMTLVLIQLQVFPFGKKGHETVETPTLVPTIAPTVEPTPVPTPEPTEEPTPEPTGIDVVLRDFYSEGNEFIRVEIEEKTGIIEGNGQDTNETGNNAELPENNASDQTAEQVSSEETLDNKSNDDIISDNEQSSNEDSSSETSKDAPNDINDVSGGDQSFEQNDETWNVLFIFENKDRIITLSVKGFKQEHIQQGIDWAKRLSEADSNSAIVWYPNHPLKDFAEKNGFVNWVDDLSAKELTDSTWFNPFSMLLVRKEGTISLDVGFILFAKEDLGGILPSSKSVISFSNTIAWFEDIEIETNEPDVYGYILANDQFFAEQIANDYQQSLSNP